MPETDLYDDLIMEHIRNARNYRAARSWHWKTTGTNPLCGDEITLYLGLRHGRIDDISFQCTCCGISMASASIMTELLQGKSPAESRQLARSFLALFDGDTGLLAPTREQQAIVAAARRFPSRARCAALPWSTLESALQQPPETARHAR